MPIEKVLQELGRMHLENIALREQIASLEAQIQELHSKSSLTDQRQKAAIA